MPLMGVCDECGMLLRLNPDGSCPNGHGRSHVHDTFETRASASLSAIWSSQPEEQARPMTRQPQPSGASASGMTPVVMPPVDGRPARAQSALGPDGAALLARILGSAVPTPAAQPQARPPGQRSDAARGARRAMVLAVALIFAVQILSSCVRQLINVLQGH
jgi:hypothetical protein